MATVPALAIPSDMDTLRLLCERIRLVARDVTLSGRRLVIQNLFPAMVAPGWHSGKQVHSFYEAHIILDGKAIYPRENALEQLTPGSFILHVPRTVHAWQGDDCPMLRLVIWFSMGPSESFAMPSLWPNRPELLWLTGLLFHEAEEMLPGWEDRVNAQLTAIASLLMTLFHQAETPPPQDEARIDEIRLVSVVDGILRRNLDRTVSLEEIAGEVGMSVRSLTRHFRQLANETIKQRLEGLRMDHAAALLSYTDLPLQEVAAQVGMSDPSYFSRRFREYFQIMPKEYRKRALSGSGSGN